MFTSTPLKKNFYFLTHDFSTRNRGTTIALLKVKLGFAQKTFYFLSALGFNSLPLEISKLAN